MVQRILTMARSSYIYIVCHDAPENMDSPHVIAAFTVKHEMKTWMENSDYTPKEELHVYRVPDNPSDETYRCKYERIKWREV